MTKEKGIAQISKQIEKLAQEYYRLVNPSHDELCETESRCLDSLEDETRIYFLSKYSVVGQVYLANMALMLRESEKK